MVFDDDHYYMGNLMAEVLRRAGQSVTLVTPAAEVASWTHNTLELERVAKHMHELGVTMITHHDLAKVSAGSVTLRHVYTEETKVIEARTLVPVTARLPNDDLYESLKTMTGDSDKMSLTRIGDCLAPGAIVHATYAGHRFAREFDTQAKQFEHEFPPV